MTAKKHPSEVKTRGRKKILSADARNRTIRCTDTEYAMLMARLWEIRGAQKPVISREK